MELQLRDIGLGYDGQQPLVTGFSLCVPEGETIALLGRNGVGKSTLLRVLAGIREPLHGEVLLAGEPLYGMDPKERAKRIAFVGTESISAAHLRVREVVGMGRAPYTGWLGSLSGEDNRQVDQALEMVGAAHLRNKPVDELSDGERQRVLIARALAQDTPLLLLDEPTAFLDMPNRYQITLLLRELAGTLGKTVIFSTHDLTTAIQLCDLLWVMSADRVAVGAPEDLMADGEIDVIFEGTSLKVLNGHIVPVTNQRGEILSASDDPLLKMAVNRAGLKLINGEQGSDRILPRIEGSAVEGFKVFCPGEDSVREVKDYYSLFRALRRL